MKAAKNIILFLLILTGVQFNLSAQDISSKQAVAVVNKFVSAQQGNRYSIIRQQVLFTPNDAPERVYLFALAPQGFVVVSSTNIQSPVLAYSFSNNFAMDDTFKKEIGFSLLKEIAFNDLNNNEHVANHGNRQTATLYGPYVHTMWGQVNCHDADGHLINVTNLFTPSHYAAGCVAISQATILHHYTWPPKGVGTYTYTDNSGSSRGTYSVDYENTEYQWPLTLERYRAKYSTTEQREAAGEVAYHCAVTLQMNFESNGSTSNVNRIPTALAHHFRFTALYRSRSSSTFWSLLDSNMVYKKPAVLAVKNNSGGGHSVVCDGLRIDEDGSYFYHLNMGWWGASNGWYKIRGSFNAGSYTSIVGAAMNIIPEPMIEVPEIWSDSIEFDLKWSYPEKAEAQAFEVQKSVNGGNWVTISDQSTDTAIHMVVDPEKEYKFRVRAKTNGKWYQNSWSTETELKRKYVGIDENPLSSSRAYPNPFSNKLTLDLSLVTENPVHVAVYDLTGKEIEKREITSEKSVRLFTDGWNRGLYFIRISGENHSFTLKTIKN
ncbi:MAG: hypothetical protein DRJ09_04120 [Bacteroidetes bacterium]|nr:MAG: hypothetical protein DRJ09_04120 [Bacteroidota bacterium]